MINFREGAFGWGRRLACAPAITPVLCVAWRHTFRGWRHHPCAWRHTFRGWRHHPCGWRHTFRGWRHHACAWRHTFRGWRHHTPFGFYNIKEVEVWGATWATMGDPQTRVSYSQHCMTEGVANGLRWLGQITRALFDGPASLQNDFWTGHRPGQHVSMDLSFSVQLQ